MNDEIERLRKKSTLFCCMVVGILHYLHGVTDENKKKLLCLYRDSNRRRTEYEAYIVSYRHLL
jgi:hypothetical protein